MSGLRQGVPGRLDRYSWVGVDVDGHHFLEFGKHRGWSAGIEYESGAYIAVANIRIGEARIALHCVPSVEYSVYGPRAVIEADDVSRNSKPMAQSLYKVKDNGKDNGKDK